MAKDSNQNPVMNWFYAGSNLKYKICNHFITKYKNNGINNKLFILNIYFICSIED